MTMIAIANINALLPSIEGGKSYKVEINTEKYNELKSETKNIQCTRCKAENLLNSIKQYNLELDWLEQILAKNKTKRMWVCNECKKSNIFNNDDITVIKKGEPYYFGIMPAPPQRQSGIRGRMTFYQEFEKWYSIAMPEIEAMIGLYRLEYAKQDESEAKEYVEAEI